MSAPSASSPRFCIVVKPSCRACFQRRKPCEISARASWSLTLSSRASVPRSQSPRPSARRSPPAHVTMGARQPSVHTAAALAIRCAHTSYWERRSSAMSGLRFVVPSVFEGIRAPPGRRGDCHRWRSGRGRHRAAGRVPRFVAPVPLQCRVPTVAAWPQGSRASRSRSPGQSLPTAPPDPAGQRRTTQSRE
jgi:hypothetical protein